MVDGPETRQEGLAAEPSKVAVNTKTFVCPNCGGAMKYDIKKGIFRCEACLSEGEVPTDHLEVKAYDFEGYHERENASVAFEGVAVVHCQTCGYEITFEASQIATTCPMCSSTQIATVKQQGGIPPEGIIPFRVDEADAKQSFAKWVKSRWFAPNDFKKRCGEGSLYGMYLPYWTYDANTMAYYKGQGGTEYTEEDEDGNTTTHVTWSYVSGMVSSSFDDILISATAREGEIEGILPFHTVENTVPYDPSYLAGHHAELYTVKADEGFERAKGKMEGELKCLAEADIERDYDQSNVTSLDVTYTDVTYKHVLLPVWTSRYGYKSKTYTYYVNGETGVVAGERPYSVPKIVAAVLAVIAIILTIFFFMGEEEYAAADSMQYRAAVEKEIVNYIDVVAVEVE